MNPNGLIPRALERSIARKFKRLTAGLLLAITMLGVGLATAAPAGAAGGIGYCFKHTNGANYTYDAYLELYINGRWVKKQNLGRSVDGCDALYITGTWRNYPARVVASMQVGAKSFWGVSPYYAPADAQLYQLGVGYVNS